MHGLINVMHSRKLYIYHRQENNSQLYEYLLFYKKTMAYPKGLGIFNQTRWQCFIFMCLVVFTCLPVCWEGFSSVHCAVGSENVRLAEWMTNAGLHQAIYPIGIHGGRMLESVYFFSQEDILIRIRSQVSCSAHRSGPSDPDHQLWESGVARVSQEIKQSQLKIFSQDPVERGFQVKVCDTRVETKVGSLRDT